MHTVLLTALIATSPTVRHVKACQLSGFAYISSYTENSSLTAERCRPADNDPSVALCTFVELNFSAPLSDEELRKRAEEDRAEAKKNEATAKIKMSEFQEVCRKGPRSAESWITAQLELTKPQEKRRSLERARDSSRVLCACRTAECVLEEMLRQADADRRICKVRFQKYELALKHTATNRWVNTSGPNGMCDSVEVTTIDLDPENSCLPTVTWVRASANLNANESCKGLQLNVPTTWSWKSDGTMVVKCEALKFTP